MTEKKKTVANNYALAFGESVENSTDIRLLNKDAIKNCGSDLACYSIEEILLYNAIPTKRNFFYVIECYDSYAYGRELLFKEYGVGELYKKGRGNFLKREFQTKFFAGIYEQPTRDKPKVFEKQHSLIVKSYIPKDYLDLYAYPYSVLCSIERGVPTPVELEENTLLGRLDDTIQSIDKDELRRILTDEAIVDAVNQTESPINLKSKYLELNNDSTFFAPSVSFKAIYTNKKKPPKPARGTIIFNDQAGCFEGFDGVTWKKLKWVDE